MKDHAPRILIKGFGLITPLGLGAWSTCGSLMSGLTIFGRSPTLPPDIVPIDLVKVLGGVQVARHSASDPSVDLAERASREAMYMAGVGANERLDTFVGASKGAVHALDRYVEDWVYDDAIRHGMPERFRSNVRATPPLDRAWSLALGPLGYMTEHLKRRIPLGPAVPFVSACASSLTALHHARQALLHPDSRGHPKRVLVVTSEAALLPLFIFSYMRLGVLPPTTRDAYLGRPLHPDRCGFALCEMGAAVVLEREDEPSPDKRRFELVDSATGAEASDMVRPAPGKPALEHVARRLMEGRTIDMIHPHATGTVDHDPAELEVYSRVLQSRPAANRGPVRLYASKGALGHGLGASGLASLVAACMFGQLKKCPGMPWLDRMIRIPDRLVATQAQGKLPATSTHAIFAAGFGGHVAGAVVKVG